MVEVPLSKRALSIFIVTLMVMSSFAGVSWLAGESGVNAQTYDGSIGIVGHEVWYGTTVVEQSLVIGEGDVLEVIDGSLLFKQMNITGDESFIVVEDGGELILRNSTLAPLLYIGSDVPCLGVLVRNGGSLVMEDSEATFAGHMLFDDATLVMNGSSISGLDTADIDLYCDAMTYPSEFFSCAPVIAFFSSDAMIADSYLDDTFYNTTEMPTSMHHFDYPFVSDAGPDSMVMYKLERDVSSVSPYDTTTGNDISAIQRVDGVYYRVQPGTTMSFDAVDMLGTLFSDTDTVMVTAHAVYRAPAGYHDDTDDVSISLATALSPEATLSPINDTAYPWDPSSMEVREVEVVMPAISSMDLSTINVSFTNTDASEYVEFDSLWFEVQVNTSDAYRNINVYGDSQITVVDSYMDVDSDYSGSTHNAISVHDTSEVYLYGVEFDMNATTYPFQRAIEIHETDLRVYPDSLGPNNNGSAPVFSFRGTGSSYDEYQVMEIASFNVNGFDCDIDEYELTIESTGALSHGSTEYVQWALDGTSYTNTSILPTAGYSEQVNVATGVEISNTSELSGLHITYYNDDTQSMTFDRIFVEFSISPTVYVYKWADVVSVNGDDIPLPGVDASVSTMSGGDPVYYTPQGVSTTPPQDVLDVRGLDVSDYMITDEEGTVQIPLLTDIVDNDDYFGTAIEGYLLDMSYLDSQGRWYNVTDVGLDLPHYPSMSFENTTMVVPIEAVFTDLVIEGDDIKLLTDYRTFGNILVKDNATLILDGCGMEFFQFSPEANGIYVMDAATLIMYESSIESLQSAWLTVNGSGSLIMYDSTLSIGAMFQEDATIVLDESRLSTTEVDISSSSTFTAVNSTIESLLIVGDSVGTFTNVSVPTLVIRDDASIEHWRWLHMTVYDGSGVPIEGADIGLTEIDDETPWGEFVSNGTGEVLVAVPSESMDTFFGLSYDGKYRVNASFWYDGEEYVLIDRDGSLLPYIDVIMPYSNNGSLSQGGVEMEIVMGEVLPDLYVTLSVDNSSVYRTRTVNITANVTNDGVIAANNITIRFMDGDTMLGEMTVDVLQPDSWVNVTMPWVATYPLGEHNISVIVDPYDSIRELNEGNNTAWTPVIVNGISELDVKDGDMTVDPFSLTVNDTSTVTLRVYNNGDIDSPSFTVRFYDNDVMFDERTISTVLVGSHSTTSASWTPTTAGQHVVKAVVDPTGSVEEVYEDNNEVELTVTVNDYADLRAITVGISPTAPFVEVGQNVTLSATVANDGQTTATSVPVQFWLGSIGNGTLIDTAYISSIMSGYTVQVQGTWIVGEQSGIYENVTIWMLVNPIGPGMTIETDRSDNNVSTSVPVVDARPDLSVSELEVMSDQVIHEASIGRTVTIDMEITNSGMTSAASVLVEVLFIQGDTVSTISTTHVDVIAGATVPLNTTWMVDGTVGDGFVEVVLNSDGAIDDRGGNETHAIDFTVLDAVPKVTVDSGVYQYDADSTINVMGSVVNNYNGDPLVGAAVIPVLEDMAGNRIAEGNSVNTSSSGRYTSTLHIPSSASGDYVIVVMVVNGEESGTGDLGINVKATSAGETSQPWWIWVMIFAIVAAIIIGFSYYLYRYGLGKMVECGECGAMIPEASKRCPNCGVEFETGTAKCSECGAWIPADSKRCPECGAIFLTEAIEEDEDEYIKSMRRQYEEILDGYREQARGEMGNKFSEAKFLAWWKKHPMYINFEDWLSQEEGQRKSGSFPCPSCGILNPKDAKVCHKCGTIFEDEELPNSGRRAVVRMGDVPEDESTEDVEDESEGSSDEPSEEPEPADEGAEPTEAAEAPVEPEGPEDVETEGEGSEEVFDPAKKSTSLRRIVRKRKAKPPEGGGE